MEGRSTFAVILLLLIVCVCTVRPSHSSQTTPEEGEGEGEVEEKRAGRPSPNPNSYRLPTNVRPTHYALKLKPQIYEGGKENFSFEGSVSIQLECTEATDVIVLHKDRLDINSSRISVTKEGDQTNLFKSLSEGLQQQFLYLNLSQQLEVRQKYVVEIGQFSGPLSADGLGLYLSHYNDSDGEVYLVASQLEVAFARKAFPCFDEPRLKATFDVTLVRRSDTGRNYFSLSNNRLLSRNVIDGGPWVEDRFETTPNMSTYLLAFVICDFEMVESNSSTQPPVLYRTFAPKTVIKEARRAHEIGLKVFNRISKVFQPDYSQALSKMDNMWVPSSNHGAMENWGLIIYSIKLLEHQDQPRKKLFLVKTITHELAHQWFGNFVSPKWWQWAWLNEGFASWFGIYITEQVFPQLNMIHNWLNFKLQRVMEIDAKNTSHALEIEPYGREEIKLSFDGVSYHKAAALIRMMQFIMGNNTFITSLNHYLMKYQYDNADSTDLFTILDETMKNERNEDSFMTTKMTSWISRPGFPVVEVRKTDSGYTLSQKRYLASSAEGDGSYWEIPITYATLQDTSKGRSRNDIEWLSGQATLDIGTAPNSWILVNIDQIAYCRVLYDRDSWDALINQLNHDHTMIGVINRAQLIHDAWAFTKHRKLELSVALRTLDFLRSEVELLPWLAFQNRTGDMEMILQTSDLYEDFQKYMRKLVQNPIKRLTLDILKDTSPSDLQLRGTLATYACRYGLPACVDEAKKFFNDWKETGVFRSHSTLRSLYFCTAVTDSDVNWQYALAQYISSDISDDNKPPLAALGCSSNPDNLREFLRKCLSGTEGISRSETPNCVYALSSSAGRRVAMEFLLENPTELQDRFKDHIGTMVDYVTMPFYSTEFFNDHLPRLKEKFSSLQSELTMVENRAKSRLDWMNTNRAAIESWLQNALPR